MKVNAIKLQEAKLDPTNVESVKSVLAQVQKYQTNPNINSKSFQNLINACNLVFNSESYAKAQQADKNIPDKATAIKSLSNLNTVAQAISQANAKTSPTENPTQKTAQATQDTTAQNTSAQANTNTNASTQANTNQANTNQANTISSIGQKLASLTASFTPEQKQQLLNTVKQSLGIKESVDNESTHIEDIL